MFVIIQEITKAIGRLEFLSHGLLLCILMRYILISPRNAGQRNPGKNLIILHLRTPAHLRKFGLSQ